MLVLTREVGEVINVGSDIRIFLIRPGTNKVRIGIDAPKGIRVLRSELVEECANCGNVPGEGDMRLVAGFCETCNAERAAK